MSALICICFDLYLGLTLVAVHVLFEVQMRAFAEKQGCKSKPTNAQVIFRFSGVGICCALRSCETVRVIHWKLVHVL
jgi:hypothetical protein